MNVDSTVSPLLETLGVEVQLEKKKTTPSKLSGETSSETYIFREEIPIDIDRDINKRLVTSHHGPARSGFPPLILSIG